MTDKSRIISTTLFCRNLPILAALGILLIILSTQLTRNDLIWDEAVEYFYSSVMSGPIPNENSTNMYERICSTYQPPLYNIVMYCWLKVSSRLWWFRIFSVLMGLIGAAGIYKTINFVTRKRVYSAIATLLYGLLPIVCWAELDCSEYSLMMAWMCWATYYFVRSIGSPTSRDLGLFMLFNVLAIYSQYGSGIAIFVYCIILLVLLLARKDWKGLVRLVIYSAIALIVAVLPLYWFFARIQAAHMGVFGNHDLMITKGNIFSDMYSAFAMTIWSWNYFDLTGVKLLKTLLAISIIAAICFKDKRLRLLALAFVVVWIAFYLLVAFQIYGIIVWEHMEDGTANIGTNGYRYSLFMLPLFCALLGCGIGMVWNRLCSKVPKRAFPVLIAAAFALCGYIFYIEISSVLSRGGFQSYRKIADYIFEKADRDTPIYIISQQPLQTWYHIITHSLYEKNGGEYDITVYDALKLEDKERDREYEVFGKDRFYFSSEVGLGFNHKIRHAADSLGYSHREALSADKEGHRTYTIMLITKQ